jgi:hypothetical protein
MCKILKWIQKVQFEIFAIELLALKEVIISTFILIG